MLDWSNKYKVLEPVQDLLFHSQLRVTILNRFLVVLFLLGSVVAPVQSEDYSTVIKNVEFEVETDSPWVELNAELDFRLSPIAKEALQKGIVLTWVILIRVEEKGLLWNTTLEEKKINYKIKNHELLNLYSVDKDSVIDMFSTLNALLNAISKIRHLAIIKKHEVQKNKKHQVAIKVLFDREALPIPLRPISYFDSQWALSSQWTLWSL